MPEGKELWVADGKLKGGSEPHDYRAFLWQRPTSLYLAFTTGMAQKPRLRPMTARSLEVLRAEIRAAKQRFGLPADVPVVSCYEAVQNRAE